MALLTPTLVGTPGAAVSGSGAAPTLTPGTGSGYAAGDTLVCFCGCSSAAATVTTPDGWTPIFDRNDTTGDLHLVAFAKTATSGSEAAPSLVWKNGATNPATDYAARVCAFRNLVGDLSQAIDVLGTETNNFLSSTFSAGGSAMTTISDKDLVMTFTVRREKTGIDGTPTGFTAIGSAYVSTAKVAIWSAYKVQSPPATLGGSGNALNFAVNFGTGNYSLGMRVAFKAASDVVTVTYNDSPSGAISSTGTRIESKQVSDSRSGAVTFSGARTESRIAAENPIGAVNFNGTLVESRQANYSDTPIGALVLSGTTNETYQAAGAIFYDDGPIGTIWLYQERTCEESVNYNDSPIIEIPPGTFFGGNAADISGDYDDTPVGAIIFSGHIQPPDIFPVSHTGRLSGPSIGRVLVSYPGIAVKQSTGEVMR